MRRILCVLLAMAMLAAAPVRSRQLKFEFPSMGSTPKPSSSSMPSETCVSNFNAMVSSGVCGQGASLSSCCAALSALGTCLDDIVAAMEQEADKYADTLDAIKSNVKQCGGGSTPGTGSSFQEPAAQCVADFNAIVTGTGPCANTPSFSATQCCAALKSLGSCLSDIVSAMAHQQDKYADQLKWLEMMATQCGTGATSPSGPSTNSGMDEQCLQGLMGTFDNGGACASSSATACCNSLDNLGKGCLESFLAYAKQTDTKVHDGFIMLLQSCGWTITSSNSGTRAAPEVTTQAMVRLQEVGAAKLATAPKEARRALGQSAGVDLEWPVAKVAATAMSKFVV